MPSTPPNVVNGTNGNDFINLSASTIGTTVNAFGGADTVWGSQGSDAIFGGSGGNIASGIPQELNGQGGDDAISGGGGNDLIRGGAGADFLFGGGGNDTFLLYKQDLVTSRPNGPGTQDVVADFRGAGGWTNQGQNDFIALAGFGSGATLVFDGRGAANAAGQLEYYHVADQGTNYYFGVVVADRAPNAAGTPGSLGLGDYAFF